MVVEYVRYEIDADRHAAFRSAYAAAGQLLAADPHCRGYELSQGVEEPDRFVVRIEWDSTVGHLQGFRQDPRFGAFFALVRPYLGDLQEMAHYEVERSYQPVEEVPTLFDWAGGEQAFERLINAFYDRIESDDLIGRFFPDGVTPQHRAAVTRWWVEVFGGPALYSPDGGYPRMVQHHRNLQISSSQRLRFATLMSLAADDAGLPDDPEFRAAFVSYVEWGTRLAVLNSQVDAEVVPDAPVPRWGWGVAPPYLSDG